MHRGVITYPVGKTLLLLLQLSVRARKKREENESLSRVNVCMIVTVILNGQTVYRVAIKKERERNWWERTPSAKHFNLIGKISRRKCLVCVCI